MSDNKLLQKPSQNLSKSTTDSKPNDKQKSNKEVNDNESSKMTPQYQVSNKTILTQYVCVCQKFMFMNIF